MFMYVFTSCLLADLDNFLLTLKYIKWIKFICVCETLSGRFDALHEFTSGLCKKINLILVMAERGTLQI